MIEGCGSSRLCAILMGALRLAMRCLYLFLLTCLLNSPSLPQIQESLDVDSFSIMARLFL